MYFRLSLEIRFHAFLFDRMRRFRVSAGLRARGLTFFDVQGFAECTVRGLVKGKRTMKFPLAKSLVLTHIHSDYVAMNKATLFGGAIASCPGNKSCGGKNEEVSLASCLDLRDVAVG